MNSVHPKASNGRGVTVKMYLIVKMFQIVKNCRRKTVYSLKPTFENDVNTKRFGLISKSAV